MNISNSYKSLEFLMLVTKKLESDTLFKEEIPFMWINPISNGICLSQGVPNYHYNFTYIGKSFQFEKVQQTPRGTLFWRKHSFSMDATVDDMVDYITSTIRADATNE